MPAFSHINSPRKFTQQQLFACLVLKNFLKLDYRGLANVLCDCPALAEAIELKSIPHYTTFQKAARRLLTGPLAERLLDETVEQMQGRKNSVSIAAIDSTGLQCTAASAYFVRRREKVGFPWKKVMYHRYPKLSFVCDASNHFILSFRVGRGPRPDVDEFKDLLEEATNRTRIGCILADAGYDSESNHKFAREQQGVRTIIPARHGRPTDKPASGKYRRLMQTRFNRKKYRQRSQVETTVSMIKRRQGSHVKARKPQNQRRDLMLMVLTHNIMILWLNILFYRAIFTRFFPSNEELKPQGHGAIVQYDLETRKEIQLTDLGGYSGGLNYSPDGATIAFHRTANATTEIWVMGHDGTNAKQITETFVDEYSPCWSPDGKWIAFTAGTGHDGLGTFDLWLMRPDGSGRRLVSAAGNTQMSPQWRTGNHYLR